MICRSLSRRQRALVLVAVMYLVAWVLAVAVGVAASWDVSRGRVRPAQHGPIEPAPTPAGGS